MIETPLIMNRSLAKHRDRQRPFECLLKKRFDLSRLREHPRTRASVANERSAANSCSFRNATKFSNFLVAFDLDQRLRDLRVCGSDLILDAADFQLCFGHGTLRLL